MLNDRAPLRDASVDEKVAFLSSTDAYPERPEAVEAVETHMSWVFLAGPLAYKLKKPVRYDFLDFSTTEARRENCEREIRLNRRLAGGVYRRIVPLILRSDGTLRLGGEGITTDWLVEMRRLPAHRMLDAALRAGTVSADDIRRVGRLLNRFYRRAPRVAVPGARYRKRFEDGIRANHDELSKPHYGLDARRIGHLARAQQAFIARDGGLLERRARDGRIVDAHGDLRPEHVCLTPRPVIIDCLEFKREFRLLDPADELAYLAMECDRLGAPAVGDRLLRAHLDAAGDGIPDRLISFYKAFRAFLRARIAIWHIADHEVRDIERWRARAWDYLRLAEALMQIKRR